MYSNSLIFLRYPVHVRTFAHSRKLRLDYSIERLRLMWRNMYCDGCNLFDRQRANIGSVESCDNRKMSTLAAMLSIKMCLLRNNNKLTATFD